MVARARATTKSAFETPKASRGKRASGKSSTSGRWKLQWGQDKRPGFTGYCKPPRPSDFAAMTACGKEPVSKRTGQRIYVQWLGTKVEAVEKPPPCFEHGKKARKLVSGQHADAWRPELSL